MCTILPDDGQFSFFKRPISNIMPYRAIGLTDVYRYVKGNYAKSRTEKLRSITDPKDRKLYKANNFDYCTFSGLFGKRGETFLAIAIVLFAFSSMLGWSYQGEVAFQYLFGRRFTALFRLGLAAAAAVGAVIRLDAVLALTDICNALMCYPNLTAVLVLSGVVAREARNR